MKSAKVVIGANWGDEGKGLLCDYYASPTATVVRFNGGAQAGHTVCRGGVRHVFHHFGSGTLRGAGTYLSRFFINNPILYFREMATLGVSPWVAADAMGLVSTPYDMMINQMVEHARGTARHGSCGVGINETVKRTEAGYAIVLDDLGRLSTLRAMLHDIRAEWVPARLAELGITASDEWQDRLGSDAILDRFVEYCDEYRRQITVCALGDCPGDIIFEGAQGLLLDEDHRFFPHVTHSHTGLHNVVALADDAAITRLDVTYVTRAYATRHGAGPFPREVPGLAYPDTTNVPNDWQGTLRFGLLDLDLLAESVTGDLRHAANIAVRHGLAVTCLDQVGESIDYWHGDKPCRSERSEMLRRACDAVGAAFCLVSDGPMASAVTTFTGALVVAT